jgi:hypothetical protein
LNLPPEGIKPNSLQLTERLIPPVKASDALPDLPDVAAPRVGAAGFEVKALPLDEHPAAATPSTSDIETRNRVLIDNCLRDW